MKKIEMAKGPKAEADMRVINEHMLLFTAEALAGYAKHGRGMFLIPPGSNRAKYRWMNAKDASDFLGQCPGDSQPVLDMVANYDPQRQFVIFFCDDDGHLHRAYTCTFLAHIKTTEG